MLNRTRFVNGEKKYCFLSSFSWYTWINAMTTTGKPLSPGEMVKALLKERGWTQEALSIVTGRSEKAINDIIRGKSGVSLEMALCLAAAFGNTPEEWLSLETAYRLSLVTPDTSEIEKRAALFSRGPITEMQRRGWIGATDSVEELKSELDIFFGHNELLSVAARRTDSLPELTPAESAWCFQAKRLGSTLLASRFSENRIPKLKTELRKLAAHPKELRYLSSLFTEYGIRFVVVEPLAGVKIDGATFWDDIGPIIAVTLRHDRIDGFWFTVMHELSHVRHGDPISVDRVMIDAEEGVLVRLATDEAESRADNEASNSLIPSAEMDSFIRRIGPLYPKDRIIQFANRIRIHPGIIVGQLQYRREIGYRSLRDQLVKIRDIVTSTALTDGWGQAISPSMTRRPC
jgi:HTH-type transcriptional regulator/antitoxin HigA